MLFFSEPFHIASLEVPSSGYRFAEMAVNLPHNDPKMPIILCKYLQTELDEPRDWSASPSGCEKLAFRAMPLGQSIYETLLKPRNHFFLKLWTFYINIRGRDRELALASGSFGLWGGELAVVRVDDTARLSKYMALYKQNTEYPEDMNAFLSMRGLSSVNTGFINPVYFIQKLIRVVCAWAGHHVKWDELVDMEGHLRQDHPLVEKLNLSLPHCIPVVMFGLLPDCEEQVTTE